MRSVTADQLPIWKVQFLTHYFGWTDAEFEQYVRDRLEREKDYPQPPGEDLSYNPLAKKESTR